MNIVELRNMLIEAISRVENNEMSIEKLQALTNASGKILLSVGLELAYNKMRNNKPDILFLSNEIKIIGAEHCQCPACADGTIHASDCAVHNEPFLENGPCDCGAK